MDRTSRTFNLSPGTGNPIQKAGSGTPTLLKAGHSYFKCPPNRTHNSVLRRPTGHHHLLDCGVDLSPDTQLDRAERPCDLETARGSLCLYHSARDSIACVLERFSASCA